MSDLTPQELEEWLEWAGVRLIAMPGKRIGPDEYRSFWPDFSQDKFEITEFRIGLGIRMMAPSNKEIPIVEEILTLPSLCKDIRGRRTLHMRSLLHPINLRHIFPWKRIAEILQSDPRTISKLHHRCLIQVAQAIPPAQVYSLSSRLQEL